MGLSGIWSLLAAGMSMCKQLAALVSDLVVDGGSQEDAESIPVPEKHLGLQMRDMFYRGNLRSLYAALT